MTCDICRGDSGPYRRCADPHECLARLEGQRDTLETEVERLRNAEALAQTDAKRLRAEVCDLTGKLDVANSMTPDTELAEARLEIERLRRVSETGTAEAWMELVEPQKRLWFALALEDSRRRKAAEVEAKTLRAVLEGLRDAIGPHVNCTLPLNSYGRGYSDACLETIQRLVDLCAEHRVTLGGTDDPE